MGKGSANVCKVPDSKHFRLFKLRDLCCKHSVPPLWHQSSQRQWPKWMNVAAFLANFIYENWNFNFTYFSCVMTKQSLFECFSTIQGCKNHSPFIATQTGSGLVWPPGYTQFAKPCTCAMRQAFGPMSRRIPQCPCFQTQNERSKPEITGKCDKGWEEGAQCLGTRGGSNGTNFSWTDSEVLILTLKQS